METFQRTDGGMAEEPGNRLLEVEIRERIRRLGRITFAEFMDLALYHPKYGYYSCENKKLGARGDFSTSPETHPVFGFLMGRLIEQMWSSIGKPDEFTVVEMGAGNGTMCSQILSYARSSGFHLNLRYNIVEKSRELTERQRDHLNTLGLLQEGNVSWFDPTDGSPLPKNVVGCFVSNELIDAFPVHRVMMSDGQLREIYVAEDDGKLLDAVGELSTPALQEYFEDLGISLADGMKAEVNLAMLDWIRQVAESLDAGFVVTIDYGYSAEEMFSQNRRDGTLLTYFRHTFGTNPYVRVGLQDMTAHVDFTSLMRAGKRAGLEFMGLVSQADFLTSLGLEGAITSLERRNLTPAVYYDNKFAIRRLVSSDGLGKFKVLVQRKGVEWADLDCFNPCNDWKRELIIGRRELEVPLLDLSEEH